MGCQDHEGGSNMVRKESRTPWWFSISDPNIQGLKCRTWSPWIVAERMGFGFHSSVFSRNAKLRLEGMEQQAANKYAARTSFCLPSTVWKKQRSIDGFLVMDWSKWKRIVKIYEVRMRHFLHWLWLCCSSGKLCEEGASHQKPKSFTYAIHSSQKTSRERSGW